MQKSARLSPNNIKIIIILCKKKQIASIFQRLFQIYFVLAYKYSCAQGLFLQFHSRVPADLVWWISWSRDDIFLNKRSQVLPILIILSDLENCKGFESTSMSNQCENHSVHEGRAVLQYQLLELIIKYIL